MPRGFTGPHAVEILTQATTAHNQAQTAGRRTAEATPTPPNMASSTARLSTRQLPFAPEDGNAGGFVPTGQGSSDNVVVSRQEYDAITRLISQADDRAGECIYNIANEIEALFQTSFVLPDAVPRCKTIIDSVKRNLSQFRSVTEDGVIQIRNFANEITNIS